MGNRIMINTNDGSVFAHDIAGNTMAHRSSFMMS